MYAVRPSGRVLSTIVEEHLARHLPLHKPQSLTLSIVEPPHRCNVAKSSPSRNGRRLTNVSACNNPESKFWCSSFERRCLVAGIGRSITSAQRVSNLQVFLVICRDCRNCTDHLQSTSQGGY